MPPTPIPSGCLAKGKRGEGSVSEAFDAITKVVGTANQNFRCIPHGAGYFSCSWLTASGARRGVVVFSPKPVVRLIG